jgi:protein involved in sex pheromone biosynthesis
MVAAVLAACSPKVTNTAASPSGVDDASAQTTADTMTKAAYADDYAAMTAPMDARTRGKVARAEVGIVSDRMHKLGSYDGLELTSANLVKHEYAYRAKFSKGTGNVRIRFDANGRVGAFHVRLPIK